MRTIEIDAAKCKGDGACVRECPVKVYVVNEGGKAEAVPAAGYMCINCGHCVSVCKSGAITVDGVSAEMCEKVDAGKMPAVDQFVHLVHGRRSARYFLKEDVCKEDIRRIIEIAAYAPTGHNSQPVEWIVVYDREKTHEAAGLVIEWMGHAIRSGTLDQPVSMMMAKLCEAWESGVDMIHRDAPHLLIAHADVTKLAPESACTIAVAYAELAAASMGIGAVWAGFLHFAATQYKPLSDYLGIPEGHRMYGGLMLGRNGSKYHYVPQRNSPVVTWS